MNKIAPDDFAGMPHRRKQEALAQLPIYCGGWLLDDLYGHEYHGFIFRLIPEYCNWPFLEAGGESQHIIEAGEMGRRTGMEVIASDPFKNYTTGSPIIVEDEITFAVKTLSRAMIRYRWEQELRHKLLNPSVSLDDTIETLDGEHLPVTDLMADPHQLGHPEADMLTLEELTAALCKLTPDTREIFLEVESGKDLATVALEHGQDYGTVQVRYWRAKKTMLESLRGQKMHG